MDFFEKCYKYDEPQRVTEAMGFYPYFTPIEGSQGSEVVIAGKRVIMIGSNNYLGLVNHPKLKEAAIAAINKYGVGCTGSRFLNGTMDLHVQLEHELAEWMGKEATLIYSTGFTTNQGVISTLCGRRDVVLIDREDHASIIEGTRLVTGKVAKYRHNDMTDLRRILHSSKEFGGLLLVTDGVFSMEGDLANLREIVPLCKQHKARIMVDEAHSMGVFGPKGRGVAEHFGVLPEVDLIMGTFSKSFASIGGFIAGEKSVINYLQHHSRPLIFSASLPPPAVASILAALQLIKSEPERRERLIRLTDKMRAEYQRLGFDTGNSQSPVIPLIIGEDIKTFKFWKYLFDHGVFTNPVITPATPPGRSLIRTSYMATHTDEQMEFVLNLMEKAGKEFGII